VEAFEERKELVENLKRQWKVMWRQRIDDRVRAEGIAEKDYSPNVEQS
jgi:hypothetical protein